MGQKKRTSGREGGLVWSSWGTLGVALECSIMHCRLPIRQFINPSIINGSLLYKTQFTVLLCSITVSNALLLFLFYFLQCNLISFVLNDPSFFYFLVNIVGIAICKFIEFTIFTKRKRQSGKRERMPSLKRLGTNGSFSHGAA